MKGSSKSWLGTREKREVVSMNEGEKLEIVWVPIENVDQTRFVGGLTINWFDYIGIFTRMGNCHKIFKERDRLIIPQKMVVMTDG